MNWENKGLYNGETADDIFKRKKLVQQPATDIKSNARNYTRKCCTPEHIDYGYDRRPVFYRGVISKIIC